MITRRNFIKNSSLAAAGGLTILNFPLFGKNAPSNKMGKKDIIKIDSCTSVNFDVIGYVDPNATVNIIKDSKLAEKKTIAMPETLTNVIKCKNPRCITSVEQELPHIFKLTLCSPDKNR